MGGYTYAIGDAHGRFDLVCEAISLAECDLRQRSGQTGTFVCCGDFIDRGPQSRQIVDLFIQGPSLSNWQWIVLAGNHEDMMRLALAQPMTHMNWWIGNGGGQTLMSYGVEHGTTFSDAATRVPEEHQRWLAQLRVHYLDRYRAFVHAGFDPEKSIEDQSREYITWVRDARWTDYAFHGRHVVHGHEQFADGPILNPNKSNIDTFAWLHGRLAVAVFDDDMPGGPIEVLWAEGPPAEVHD